MCLLLISSSELSMCFARFSEAMEPDDKLLGLFVHLSARNWHDIVINGWAHNALSNSLDIILDRVFHLALDVLPIVI